MPRKRTAPQAAQSGVKKTRATQRKAAQGKAQEAEAPAANPLVDSGPEIDYIELRDVDVGMEAVGYISRHLKKEGGDYNGSNFKISTDGYERLLKMYIEVEKRTPEANGIVHIFEDFRGYGIIEVIQKQIVDFEKERKRANPDIMKMFVIVEALVFFLDESYDAIWLNVDDGEGAEQLVRLMGAMFVHIFTRLEASDGYLSPPDKSPLKNLGLVMGLAIAVAETWEGVVCDDSMGYWTKPIRQLAEKHGVELMDSKGAMVDDREEDDKQKLDFAAKFDEYKKQRGRGGMGGTHYDLTKMATVHRRQLI